MGGTSGIPRLPARLEPGSELSLGHARIERRPEGSLEACDPHGCQKLEVRPTVEVRILPAPASRRLLQVNHVYVEFESPLLAGLLTSLRPPNGGFWGGLKVALTPSTSSLWRL